MTISPTLHLLDHPVAPVFRLEGAVPLHIETAFGATLIHGKWHFPAFRPAADAAVRDLQGLTQGRLQFSPATQKHLRSLLTEKPLPADFTFVTKPFQHQVDGLVWLYNRPRGGVFFAPGLGKCKITVDLHRLTGETMLILCPAVVLRTWAREFVTHGKITDTVVIEGDRADKEALLEQAAQRMPAAVIITYESATLLNDLLHKLPFQALVLDESHRIKSIASARTKTALGLSEKAKRRVLLSGTPSLGSPFGLYPQMRLLGRYFAPENWTEFRKKFGMYDQMALQTGVLHQVHGYQNLEVLRERVLAVCLRRYLNDCIDLPERQVLDVRFDMSSDAASYYNDLVVGDCDLDSIWAREAALDGVLSHANGSALREPILYTPDVVAKLMRLEQISSGFVGKTDANPGLCNGCPHMQDCVEARIRPYTKRCLVATDARPTALTDLHSDRLDAFEGLLDGILEDPDNKVIVWTRFLHELDHVCWALKKRGINHSRVQGGMAIGDFEEAMRRFNEEPTCRVYAGQVASGIGVTLNAANYVIYYSLPWSLEHYDQSMARNYRIGQERRVVVYRLLASGTIDEDKAEALDQKVDIDKMLTAPDTAPCLVHKVKPAVPDAPCTCRSDIDRIIAKLAPIGESKAEVLSRLEDYGWTNRWGDTFAAGDLPDP